jgi:hypothetical protein
MDYNTTASDLDSVYTSFDSSPGRSKLPWHLKAQLAEDIEAFGGIQKLDNGKNKTLSTEILDKRPDLYKLYSDPIRLPITKLVYTWIEKSRKGKYIDGVLAKFDVTPYHLREQSSQTLQTLPTLPTPPTSPQSSSAATRVISPSPQSVIKFSDKNQQRVRLILFFSGLFIYLPKYFL